MRFRVRATIPVDAGNDMIRSGAGMQELLDKLMADIRPEAVYFCAEAGQRTVYMVVTIAETSELPRIAEPLWLALSCDVEFIPAMSQEDFGAAMGHVAAAGAKY